MAEALLCGFVALLGLKEICMLLEKAQGLTESLKTAKENVQLAQVLHNWCSNLYLALNVAPRDARGELPTHLVEPMSLLKHTLDCIVKTLSKMAKGTRLMRMLRAQEYNDALAQVGATLTGLTNDLQPTLQFNFSPMELATEIKAVTEAQTAALKVDLQHLLAQHHTKLYSDLALNNKDVPKVIVALQRRIETMQQQQQHGQMVQLTQQVYHHLHLSIVCNSTIHVEHTADEKALNLLAVTSYDFDKLDEEILGCGGFSQLVAKEACIWNSLRHLHVLLLLGVLLKSNPPFLVMLLMEGGDLTAYSRGKLPHEHLWLLHEVAQGMVYLHSKNILHGDLKGNNVLVDGFGRAQVANFGQLRTLSMASRALMFKNGSVGNVRWIGPERYKRKAQYRLELDVFAFAMVIYEVVVGNMPFFEEHDLDVNKDWIKDGDCPNAPTESPSYSPKLWALVDHCWAHDWTMRPTFTAIVTELNGLRAVSVAQPPLIIASGKCSWALTANSGVAPSASSAAIADLAQQIGSILLDWALSASPPKLDFFANLSLPTNCQEGDCTIWDQRLGLTNGSVTDLNVSGKPVGQSGLKVLQRALSSPDQRLTKLVLDNCGLGDSGALFVSILVPLTLKALQLRSNEIRGVSAQAIAACLPQSLTKLNMGNNRIGNVGAQAIVAHLPQSLTKLNMGNNRIGNVGAQAIVARLPQSLIELSMDDNQIGNISTQAIVACLPQSLTKLNMGNNWIGDVSAQAIAVHLPQSLIELSLQWNWIGDVSAQAIAARLPQSLTKLNMGNNRIGNVGAQAIVAHLPQSLIELCLSSNQIGDVGAQAIVACLPQSLIELNMDNILIGNVGVQAIVARLPQSLTKLSMGSNQIGDVSAQAIAVRLLQSLTKLYLSYNQIGDIGVQAIAARLLQSLIELCLSSNQIGDVGAQAIAACLPQSLIELHMDYNRIGDVGVQAIAARLPQSLTKLYMGSNQISDVGAQAIAAHLPQSLIKLSMGDIQIGDISAQAIAACLPQSLTKLIMFCNWFGDISSWALFSAQRPTLSIYLS
ncbi:serine/threonine protein kinase [Allomyces macrogynus ATCC 38327]|uniref:Serine/threonine protein kinase n=1 Tax=Allomyces macrogynus (strain ATCC 38327) TaxID=578462 RepID=A0A0L0T6Q1_ALLM3|nr:serine/threonine protein kinase [Allomyces macrogynus ATCC 38327]|eukprot:KNE70422.1 serine/threonine protein kinase [Allomyces macrogynus ATCC 38327]